MKVWIDENYNTGSLSLLALRDTIEAIWFAISEEVLVRLALSMPKRLQQYINRNSWHTDY